ncbi:MAG TPA: SDR family oxidoreductase [Bryobacteraceae bacterium]|jgi:3-oxoacyl-[acyl-carrier protein] reductase
MTSPFTLEGRVALITGAGRGIGFAVAQKLAACGAAVMINDLDAEPLSKAHAVIESEGGRVAQLSGDITAPNFPQKLVDQALSEFGAVDIIVNNAGYTWDNVIQKTTDEQFQAMLDIHVVAPFRVLRAASGYIREAAKREIAEGRRITRKVVNITSISGTNGIAGQAGYGSGKAAVLGLTRTMAKEWGRYNVTVNAVGFGLIDTRLTQVLGPEAKIHVKGRDIAVGVPQAARDSIGSIPLGRPGTTEEAAGPVLFFCSPLSDYVTGETVIASGGMHF